MIIPLGPGGGADVFTRALADELQKAWGQPVVVENRPAAGRILEPRLCRGGARRLHNLCAVDETVVYNQFLFKNLPFDPDKDLQPIAHLFFNTLALVVNGSLR